MKLKLPANERLQFLAGQYIDFLLKDGRRRSFSLATPPHDDALLELHIRHVPGGLLHRSAVQRIQGARDPALRRAARHVLPARGIGQADHLRRRRHRLRADQGRSSSTRCTTRSTRRGRWCCTGARARSAISTCPTCPAQWQQPSRNFTFIPVLSEPAPEDDWPGRTGFVHQAVLDDFADLSGYQVYACGGPAMVDAARKTLRRNARRCRRTSSSPTASPTRCSRNGSARPDGRPNTDLRRTGAIRRARPCSSYFSSSASASLSAAASCALASASRPSRAKSSPSATRVRQVSSSARLASR